MQLADAGARTGVEIYPLLAFPAAVALSVAFTIGTVPYRAPAEIPLALLAAFTVDILANRRRDAAPPRDPHTGPQEPQLLRIT